MNEKESGSLLGYRAAIQEMEALRKDQDVTLQSAKATTRYILFLASLIFGLVIASQCIIQISSKSIQSLFGLIVLLYLILIGCWVWVTLMTKTITPIKADEKQISEYLISATTEEELLRRRLSANLFVINKNRAMVIRKALIANLSVYLLAAYLLIYVCFEIFVINLLKAS